MHEFICTRKKARHREHQADRVLGDGYGIRTRSIHHRDALTSGRLQLNVVHTYTSTANYPQLGSLLQKRAIYLHGGAHQQRISGFKLLCQASVQLVRRDYIPPGFPQ